MKNREKIDVLLSPYIKRRNRHNEYTLLPTENEPSVPISTAFSANVYKGVVKKESHEVIPKSELEQYSPDQIDNRHFWRVLQKYYKCVPICGKPVKNAQEADKVTFNGAKVYGIIDEIDATLRCKKAPKMLEIGYGYGNIAMYVNTEHQHADYYGIDLLKRFDAVPNLFETDGYNIPKEIPHELDIVVSHNVFQHLTPKQRINYFTKAYDLLKHRGKLVFDCCVLTEDNIKTFNWGWKDETGRAYLQFFTQFTAIDYDYELKAALENIGFEIVKFDIPRTDWLVCVAIKK